MAASPNLLPWFETARIAAKCTQAAPAMARLLTMRPSVVEPMPKSPKPLTRRPQHPRREHVVGRLLAVVSCLLIATAAADAEPVANFPSRPIRIVVPFTPGGATDIIARKLAPAMQAHLGQSVFIENRPGANARIGANVVAKAEPDGYTILLTTNGAFVISPFIGGKPPYEALTDFAPVTLVARSSFLVVAGPKVAVSSIADLIALAKRQPGNVAYASSGVGGPPHLAAELLKRAADFDMRMIPYGGTGDVNVALLRGDVDIALGAIPAIAPSLQQQDVKALAVTSARRSAALPNVPSIAETVPGYDFSTWFAVTAPGGTPRPIIERIRAAVLSALNEPSVIEAFARDGSDIATSTPEGLREIMEADYAKYGALIKSLNIKE
jgi:tripartite-type tricarboxylate transporter receptor subunit TctC